MTDPKLDDALREAASRLLDDLDNDHGFHVSSPGQWMVLDTIDRHIRPLIEAAERQGAEAARDEIRLLSLPGDEPSQGTELTTGTPTDYFRDEPSEEKT